MQNGVRRSYYIIFTLFFLILNRALVGIHKHSSVHCFVQTEARSNNIHSSKELSRAVLLCTTALHSFPAVSVILFYTTTTKSEVCFRSSIVPIAAGL